MPVVALYVGSISFVLGVGLATLYSLSLTDALFFAVLAFGLALVARRSGGSATTAPRYLLLASLALLTFALGTARFEVASWHFQNSPLQSHVGTEVTVSGVIDREPDQRETSTHLYVKTDTDRLLVITDRYASYQYGDAIVVRGLLSKPESFVTDLGRTFNYSGYLQARGVGYSIRYSEIELEKPDQGNPVIAALLTLKHSFMDQLEELLPEPQVGLAEGLLLGVKRALGAELESAFRETGIIHIVVLSGYNIMLVVAFVTFVLGAIIPFRFQLPVGLILIAAFALIVGLSATVVRASVMAGLYLFARATNRSYLVIRALLFAGLVMIVINPYLLVYDTGFQLSFLATLGLILVAPHLDTWLAAMPKWLGREFLVATIATQIFVMPILLYQIGEFSVVSVIVNVLVLPMVPAAMLLTFVTGLVSFISGTLATLFGYLTTWSLTYILSIATWFAALPFASYVVPAFPFWVMPISYGCMGYLLWKLYQPKTAEAVAISDDLTEWKIEEESDDTKSGSDTTPIFFR